MLKENQTVYIEPVGRGFVVGTRDLDYGAPIRKEVFWNLGAAFMELVDRLFEGKLDAARLYELGTVQRELENYMMQPCSKEVTDGK